MKTLFISIPIGRHARSLLRSGILKRLMDRPDLRVVLLTPAYQDPDFREEFSFNGRIFFENLMAYQHKSSFWERICWRLLHLSQGCKPVALAILTLRDRLMCRTVASLYGDLFERYQPDLVVTSSAGFNTQADIPLVLEARRRKVRTLYIVHSWDNLAGRKGLMVTRPDLLAVWNELMKKEAVTLHHYSPEAVFPVGPPHFDLYQDPSVVAEREAFLTSLGLDPRKALLTITTGTRGVDNSYIVQLLEEAMKVGRFVRPVQILCRVHPLDSFTTPFREKYEKLKETSSVVFDFAGRWSPTLGWDPDRAETVRLVNTLKHSDVAINVSSTITIEAAILDRPVVNVRFSTAKDILEKKALKRPWRYHYRYVHEARCTYLAEDAEDLIRGINLYLSDPALHRRERSLFSEKICYRLDGRSSQRAADLILHCLNGDPAWNTAARD